MTISISFAGDIFLPGMSAQNVLISDDVKSLLTESDLSIVNLEAPVTNHRATSSQMISKDGPHLQMGEWVLDLLKNFGVKAVCLANNHIMDYGPEGLASTIASCEKHGLRYFGAGNDIISAAIPMIFDKNQRKIGFIAVCENEWSVANNASSGANGFDLINNFYSIRDLKSECDHVVVIVHGGNEHYNLPSPRIKKSMRFLVDAGADAVVMHHTHCVSGMEVYNDRPIFYGLGNFFFNGFGQTKSWYEGAVVNFAFGEKGRLSWDVRFVTVSGGGLQLRLSTAEQECLPRKDFERLSEIISDDLRLAKEWDGFVNKSAPFYSQVFSPINMLPTNKLRGLARRLGLAKYVFPRRHLVHLINYITCESHLDVSRAVLSRILRD